MNHKKIYEIKVSQTLYSGDITVVETRDDKCLVFTVTGLVRVGFQKSEILATAHYNIDHKNEDLKESKIEAKGFSINQEFIVSNKGFGTNKNQKNNFDCLSSENTVIEPIYFVIQLLKMVMGHSRLLSKKYTIIMKERDYQLQAIETETYIDVYKNSIKWVKIWRGKNHIIFAMKKLKLKIKFQEINESKN